MTSVLFINISHVQSLYFVILGLLQIVVIVHVFHATEVILERCLYLFLWAFIGSLNPATAV